MQKEELEEMMIVENADCGEWYVGMFASCFRYNLGI